MKLISKEFYLSEDVTALARALLGKVMVCNAEGKTVVCRIVETEAYRGPDDRACHAYNDRRTNRTEVMFDEGGCAYVYISYGMHHLLNVVTAPKDNAHAVLIRAVQPIEGLGVMQERRSVFFNNHLLSGGPGKVCQALNISKGWNRMLFYTADSPLRIYDDGYAVEHIIQTPRVGMSALVGEHAHWMWRFYIKDNAWVSKPLKISYQW